MYHEKKNPKYPVGVDIKNQLRAQKGYVMPFIDHEVAKVSINRQ